MIVRQPIVRASCAVRPWTSCTDVLKTPLEEDDVDIASGALGPWLRLALHGLSGSEARPPEYLPSRLCIRIHTL